MTKRILVLTMLLLFALCLFACNDAPTDFTSDYGLTVSGKIIFESAPMDGVDVVVGYESKCTTSSDGIFNLTGLKKGDEITFEKDGFVFAPDTYTVKNDVYDLRVEGFLDTLFDADDDDDVTPDEDVNSGDDSGDDVTPDNPDDGDDDGDDSDVTTPDDQTPAKVYDCTNGTLSFENDCINFVFCVESGFSSFEVFVTKDGLSTSLDTSTATEIGAVTLGGVTYVEFKIDVTAHSENGCVFSAKAQNEKGEFGTETAVNCSVTDTCAPVVITLDGTVLRVQCDEPEATFYIVINGVNMGALDSDSIDLNQFSSLNSNPATVQIVATKDGHFPSFSNQISVELSVK